MSELVGKNIANYQVVEVIDEGGRSQVYRGFQASTNRYVAIKVLKEELTQDPAVTPSFDQYAQRAAAMQNPYILPILDVGQENELHYLVTPFFETKSVASHLAWYGDPHQALNLVQAIIRGLEYIYSQGTVHANLKPTNIILNDQRQPLLADFGMANYGPATAYTSPEQTQGGVVDQRTDVYALGVLLYELLTGGTPPAGTTVNLRASRPDVPQGVEQVILKAMAPNPDQRFQTPQQLGSALPNALHPAAPQPVAAPAPVPAPAAAPPLAPQKSGPNWMGIVLGGIVVVLMCLCAIIVVPMLMDALSEQSDEVATEPTAEVLPEPTEIPVEEVEPTREPVELPTREPTEQAPPPEDDPSIEQLPSEGDGGSQICGSLGFAGGFILLGGVFSSRRKKKF